MTKEFLIKLVPYQKTKGDIYEISVPTNFSDTSIKSFLRDSLKTDSEYSLFIKDTLFEKEISFMVNKLNISEEDVIQIEYREVKNESNNFEMEFSDAISCMEKTDDCIYIGFYDGSIKKINIKSENDIITEGEWKIDCEVVHISSSFSKIICFNKKNEIMVIDNESINILYKESEDIKHICFIDENEIYIFTKKDNVFSFNISRKEKSSIEIKLKNVYKVFAIEKNLYISTLDGVFCTFDTESLKIKNKLNLERSLTDFIKYEDNTFFLGTGQSHIYITNPEKTMEKIKCNLRFIEKISYCKPKGLLAYTDGNNIKIVDLLNKAEVFKIDQRFNSIVELYYLSSGSLILGYTNKLKIYTF